MSTKITKCPSCDSRDIKEINPSTRQTSNQILCTITAECNVCNQRFNFKSWTTAGRRRGVRY